jgi:hypothetical protein
MKNHQILNQTGRSMVEMLGVLAIIGVLSVGAIAGYQKAMYKYRLNKFTAGYDQLLGYAITLSEQLEASTSSSSIDRTSLLNKLNLIPEGFTYNESDKKIYDMFGNQIIFFTRYGYNYTWALRIILDNGDHVQDHCIAIIRIAQAYNDQLINILRQDSTSENYQSKALYGEKPYPAGSTATRPSSSTLSTVTMSQIRSFCQDTTSFGNTSYNIHMLW